MRDLHALDAYRDCSGPVILYYGNAGDGTCGVFWVPSPIDRQPMRAIASAGEYWEHVSVSRRSRCPNWAEMSFIKELFFRPDETAIQFHVPVRDHINVHPYCLHLWRPIGIEIPRPPVWMVGPEQGP